MTLIIGFKCSDGLVVGADSGATMGDYVSGLRTIMQPMTKLQLVADKSIIGVSGPVGLGQLYVDCVERIHNEFRDKDISWICRRLRDEFRKDAEIALHMAAMATQVLGANARAGAITTTLVALAARDGPYLVQFDCECCPEVTTNDLPFVSIGSGQLIADPFLAFLKRIFWKDRSPSVSEGIFAVNWTLAHALDTAPGGIAPPITIGELKMEGTQPKARLLSDKELREHREMRTQAEAHIKKFEELLRPVGGEKEPPTPHSS
jgi:20S proteasome alpha/beta subunit